MVLSNFLHREDNYNRCTLGINNKNQTIFPFNEVDVQLTGNVINAITPAPPIFILSLLYKHLTC